MNTFGKILIKGTLASVGLTAALGTFVLSPFCSPALEYAINKYVPDVQVTGLTGSVFSLSYHVRSAEYLSSSGETVKVYDAEVGVQLPKPSTSIVTAQISAGTVHVSLPESTESSEIEESSTSEYTGLPYGYRLQLSQLEVRDFQFRSPEIAVQGSIFLEPDAAVYLDSFIHVQNLTVNIDNIPDAQAEYALPTGSLKIKEAEIELGEDYHSKLSASLAGMYPEYSLDMYTFEASLSGSLNLGFHAVLDGAIHTTLQKVGQSSVEFEAELNATTLLEEPVVQVSSNFSHTTQFDEYGSAAGEVTAQLMIQPTGVEFRVDHQDLIDATGPMKDIKSFQLDGEMLPTSLLFTSTVRTPEGGVLDFNVGTNYMTWNVDMKIDDFFLQRFGMMSPVNGDASANGAFGPVSAELIDHLDASIISGHNQLEMSGTLKAGQTLMTDFRLCETFHSSLPFPDAECLRFQNSTELEQQILKTQLSFQAPEIHIADVEASDIIIAANAEIPTIAFQEATLQSFMDKSTGQLSASGGVQFADQDITISSLNTLKTHDKLNTQVECHDSLNNTLHASIETRLTPAEQQSLIESTVYAAQYDAEITSEFTVHSEFAKMLSIAEGTIRSALGELTFTSEIQNQQWKATANGIIPEIDKLLSVEVPVTGGSLAFSADASGASSEITALNAEISVEDISTSETDYTLPASLTAHAQLHVKDNALRLRLQGSETATQDSIKAELHLADFQDFRTSETKLHDLQNKSSTHLTGSLSENSPFLKKLNEKILLPSIDFKGSYIDGVLAANLSVEDTIPLSVSNTSLSNIQLQAKGTFPNFVTKISLLSDGEPLSLHGELQADPFELTLDVNGSNVPIWNTPEYFINASPDIRLLLTDEVLQLTGKVQIPEAYIQYTPSFEKSFTPESDIYRVSAEDDEIITDSPKLSVDLEVVVEDDVILHTLGTTTYLSGRLNIHHDDTATTGTGNLQTHDGYVAYYDQNFMIQRGDLSFTGGFLTDPTLQVVAAKDFPGGVRVYLSASGRSSAPIVNIYSIPSEDESSLMTRLLISQTTAASKSIITDKMFQDHKDTPASGKVSKELAEKYLENISAGIFDSDLSFSDVLKSVSVSYAPSPGEGPGIIKTSVQLLEWLSLQFTTGSAEDGSSIDFFTLFEFNSSKE